MVLISLPEEADETQQQGQTVEYIMSLVLFQFGGQFALVAQTGIVDERNSGQPVTVFQFAITLYVVLAAGKIPHEIPPIHEVNLVTEEEAQVFGLRRYLYHYHLSALVVRYLLAFYAAHPVFVSPDVLGAVGVHAREHHVLCIDRFFVVIHDAISVLLVGTMFFYALVNRCPFFIFRHAVAVFGL